MQYKLRLASIPFFRFMPAGSGKKLSSTFSLVQYQKGEELLRLGEEVPGFYVVAEGTVDVFTSDYKICLASLTAGNILGEMSLIENETSAANVRVSSESARILFCEKEKFRSTMLGDMAFSAAFFHGASLVLSQRLREQNRRIVEEMQKGKTIIQEMMHNEGIVKKLGLTQSSVNVTGEALIARLAETLPILQKIRAQVPAEIQADLDQIKKAVSQVVMIDAQNFDIISQQIDQIHQYVQNIQRLLTGEQILEVQGDRNVFRVDLNSQEGSGEDIVFF